MASSCCKPCPELDICNELIDKYFLTGQYDKCFALHLPLAEQGYPLAECQIGYFYLEGLGVEKDLEKAFCRTRRAAEHGDRDGQFNLGCFYEDGTGPGYGAGRPLVPGSRPPGPRPGCPEMQRDAHCHIRAYP